MAIDNAKLFNVRIKNKYDSYENWAKSSIVLEAGEIAIASTTVDVKVDNGTVKQPALLMKVGNGTDTFGALPWLSAKAADVVAACKSEADLTTFVNNVIASAGIATDEAMKALTARVTTAEGAIDALELLVGEKSVKTQIDEAITALNLADTYDAKGAAAEVANELAAYKTLNDTAVQANTDAIAAINNADTGILAQAKEHANNLDSVMNIRMEAVEAVLTGSGEGTVAEQIQAVQDEVDALEETHTTDKATLESAIALKADQTALDAEITRAKVAEEANAAAAAKAQSDIDAFMASAEVGEAAVDTLKEIQSYIETDGTAADEMTKNIAANADAIKALQDANAEGGAVTEAIADAKKAGEAAAAAVEALEAGAVAENTAAIAQEKADREAAITQEVIDRNAAITTAKQKAAEDATTKADAAKDAAIAAAATDATTKANAAQAAAEATAAADATAKANAALADAKTHVAEEIAKLDSSVAVSSDKHVLTGVTEVDGKLTEKTEVELADVAFTGSTDDLVQGELVLVFDCGTSV